MIYENGTQKLLLTEEAVSYTHLDPLAEKYYSESLYTYCYSNPINCIDPNGKDGIYICLLYTSPRSAYARFRDTCSTR